MQARERGKRETVQVLVAPTHDAVSSPPAPTWCANFNAEAKFLEALH